MLGRGKPVSYGRKFTLSSLERRVRLTRSNISHISPVIKGSKNGYGLEVGLFTTKRGIPYGGGPIQKNFWKGISIDVPPNR